ncbi:MAG: hypothetical protein MUE39_02775 [Gammaproteobacteria bacterium]|jgi:hypothetical protein|nr:hypothetical protein [Gammaproteobacteria bacterium]
MTARPILLCAALAAIATPALALDARCPQYPEDPRAEVPAEPLWLTLDWPRTIEACVPTLQHERGKRRPLVLWEGGDAAAFTDKTAKMLLDRGLVPAVRLDLAMIPVALQLQKAGAPVVLLDARTGSWPYDLVGDPAKWALTFAQNAQVPDAWRRLPVPGRFEGWAIAAQRLRDVLRSFHEAGVRVDAVWLDYETAPANIPFEAAKASREAGKEIPARALASNEAFHRYRWQLWLQLLSAYVAAPVREVYPAASVTNWMVMLSTLETPVTGWDNRPLPPSGLTLFNATNPVAYGVDRAVLASWEKDQVPTDADAVDRAYVGLLLRQPSQDGQNRQRIAPHLDSVVWVAREVQQLPDRKVPAMSRGAFREALRHLWLRGADAMEVYNGQRPGGLAAALAEVQDSATVFDEMLKYRDFLDQGEPMTFALPAVQEAGPLWSGLRMAEQAVVRVVWLGEGEGSAEVEGWPGFKITLPATRAGTTYLVKLNREAGRLEVLSSDPPPPKDESAPSDKKPDGKKKNGESKREG